MKLTFEIEIVASETDQCSVTRIQILSPNNQIVFVNGDKDSSDTDETGQTETEYDEVKSSFRLLLIALALFSPIAVPILCYLAWLYFTGSLQEMTVAEIWIWLAPLYAITAALMIVGTPVIEWGVIRLYRLIHGKHRRR